MNINEEKVKELQTSVEKYKKEYQLYLKTKEETLKCINERIYLLFKPLFDIDNKDSIINPYEDKELGVIVRFTGTSLIFSDYKCDFRIDSNFRLTGLCNEGFYSFIYNNIDSLYTRTAEFIINTMKKNIDQLKLSIPIV